MIPLEPRILIVEDDVALGKFLTRELGHRQFQVEVRNDGRGVVADLQNAICDLLILDLNLPGMDGMDLLKEVRASKPSLPILVLTARNRTEDLVMGLEQGADDFLIKPFSFKELLARVRRLLRRNGGTTSVEVSAKVADLTVNRDEHMVYRGQRRIELTPREFAILEYLVEHAGKVVSRKSLMEDVWNMPFDSATNIVDVYMKYLRDKIDSEEDTKLIRTVRGVGYVLSNESYQPN